MSVGLAEGCDLKPIVEGWPPHRLVLAAKASHRYPLIPQARSHIWQFCLCGWGDEVAILGGVMVISVAQNARGLGSNPA